MKYFLFFITLFYSIYGTAQDSNLQLYASAHYSPLLSSDLLDNPVFQNRVADITNNYEGYISSESGYAFGINIGVLHAMSSRVYLNYGLGFSQHVEYKKYFCHNCEKRNDVRLAAVLNTINATIGIKGYLLDVVNLKIGLFSDVRLFSTYKKKLLTWGSVALGPSFLYKLSDTYELMLDAGFEVSREAYQKSEGRFSLGISRRF